MPTPLHHSRVVTNVALVEGIKCPSFLTQFLDHSECAISTMRFRKLLSVNILTRTRNIYLLLCYHYMFSK